VAENVKQGFNESSFLLYPTKLNLGKTLQVYSHMDSIPVSLSLPPNFASILGFFYIVFYTLFSSITTFNIDKNYCMLFVCFKILAIHTFPSIDACSISKHPNLTPHVSTFFYVMILNQELGCVCFGFFKEFFLKK
jgi:hypothetical protein